MTPTGATWLGVLAALAPAAQAASAPAATAPAALREYPGRYYVLHTDLPAPAAREASARMTAMAEEYLRRTRSFAGRLGGRFHFYLFARAADYRRAGGPAGSAGVYDPARGVLMASAAGGIDEDLWHVVQHEGFHQFADRVIRAELPPWAAEGLAEYFALGVWTGDGFVTGVVPPPRLRRVQGLLRAGTARPAELLALTPRQWQARLRTATAPAGGADARALYDQAWAMVHFLVHADAGRYRPALMGLLRDTAGGLDARTAFRRRFGTDTAALVGRLRQWWLAQKPDATADLYARAVVATLTSFLARAAAAGQRFADAAAFFRAARAGRLEAPPSQWLPPSLLRRALEHAGRWPSAWSLRGDPHAPALVLTWPDGTTCTGRFALAAGQCPQVRVTVTTGR